MGDARFQYVSVILRDDLSYELVRWLEVLFSLMVRGDISVENFFWIERGLTALLNMVKNRRCRSFVFHSGR